jgi:hypothetical protein
VRHGEGSVEYTEAELLWRNCGKQELSVDGDGKRADGAPSWRGERSDVRPLVDMRDLSVMAWLQQLSWGLGRNARAARQFARPFSAPNQALFCDTGHGFSYLAWLTFPRRQHPWEMLRIVKEKTHPCPKGRDKDGFTRGTCGERLEPPTCLIWAVTFTTSFPAPWGQPVPRLSASAYPSWG